MAIIKINGHHGTQSFATAEDVQSVTNLDNLHDVIITGLADGQYLIYDSNVQQWVNTTTAFITASSTDTLTNKSGNISMFTNDAGYLTSESDSQTLTFTSPNSLAISNGNTVNLSTLEVGEIDGGTY